MKAKVAKVSIVLLVVASIVGLVIACAPNESLEYAESYVTISINPEVELVADEQGNVEGVYPINVDAEVLLSETNLVGMTLEEAIDEIIDLADEAGYLDETTEDIEIGVETEDEEITSQIRTRLKDRVQKKLNGKGLGNCAVNDADMSGYDVAAARLGVTHAQAKMIERLISIDPTLTEDDLKTQTMSQLATRYASLMGNGCVNAALRDEFRTQRDALIANNAERNELLAAVESLELQLENTELSEEERTALQAQLDTKNAELETANQEMMVEIAALREEYKAQVDEAKNQQKAALQLRKQQKHGQG